MKNFLFKVATLIADSTVTTGGEGALNKAYNSFKNVVGIVLPIIIAVVLLIGMFFGISLGIKFAKAEDTDARDKAKGQLVNLAIGIGVTAVILVVCYTLVQANVFEGLFDGLKSNS